MMNQVSRVKLQKVPKNIQERFMFKMYILSEIEESLLESFLAEALYPTFNSAEANVDNVLYKVVEI